MESSPIEMAPPRQPGTAGKSALGFFAVVLALYALPGVRAQMVNPALGLAWSEVFAFLLPAMAAAAGSNLAPFAFLRLARRPTGPQLLLGLLCGVAGFFAANGIMGFTTLVLPREWVRAFDLSHLFQGPPRERAAMALLATLLAPLCEEAAFRGYLQGALLTRHGPRAALAGSAALFAVMHLDPVRLPAVLALGLLFGWLAWRAGSVWPAVAAHAANNGIASALATARSAEGDLAGLGLALALGMLVAGAAALALLAAAYRTATPAPPPVGAALVLRNPADPSLRFRWERVPAGYLAAGLLGIALLLALAGFGGAPAR